jgi:2-C-methyl-D-erythritol 4-phosphate cytidylyltransferase
VIERLERVQQARGRTVAVVLSAGQGSRMGAMQNKVFLPLAGKPLLAYTIDAFGRAREVDEVVMVAHPREVESCRCEIVERYDFGCVTAVVAGGASRHQSEDRALEALRERIEAGGIDVVLIHDGARPFVEPEDIDALVREARLSGGALLGTRVEEHEVIARRDAEGMIAAIQTGNGLWRAQTPQAFDARTLLAAYDLARVDGFEGTDTASSYERLGRAVRMVEGHTTNFKVTTPDDLVRAEALLRQRGEM